MKRDERKILAQFYSSPMYKKDNDYHILYFFYVNYNGRFVKADFLNDSYLHSLWYMKKNPSKEVSVFINRCCIIDNKNRIVAEWDRLVGVHEPYHLNEIIHLSSIIEDNGVLYGFHIKGTCISTHFLVTKDKGIFIYRGGKSESVKKYITDNWLDFKIPEFLQDIMTREKKE
ncbi:MAG: hypothetical protein B7C24_03065 [Bacteroidetes bacterium 4572_77]|nr:MAG: hypothetical protein B7C24_03065 [Bacteroidetes bacterium 4572_77]